MMKTVSPERWNPIDLEDEIWKPVPNFPDYMISNKGRAKRLAGKPPSTKRELLLIIRNAQVLLYAGKTHYDAPLARLILELFIGPPPSAQHLARHLDDNRDNNDLANLAWGTHKQNGEDASRNGRLPPQAGKVISEDQKQKNRVATLRQHQENPELARAHSQFLKRWWQENRRIWITDGTKQRRVPPKEIPSGWWAGRL